MSVCWSLHLRALPTNILSVHISRKYCLSFALIAQNSVPFRDGERIGFSYLVSQKYAGDKALVKILRNSETLEFDIKLATHTRLIPAHIKGKPPSYYIVAGFVFSAVSVPYLRSEVHYMSHYLEIIF